jgi:hypothetical protein
VTSHWAIAQWAGRLFALGSLKNYKSSPTFWTTFFQRIDYVLILTKKWVGATIWVKFSQTRLVTLVLRRFVVKNLGIH